MTAKTQTSAACTPAQSFDLRGCPVRDLKEKLRVAGLRPTRQRLALGWILFSRGDRHVTAEHLFEEAQAARIHLSLATVYNTLNQFTEAGLLRQVAVEGAKTYFDTRIEAHHHFLFEDKHMLIDIPGSSVAVSTLPSLPDGYEVERIEVVVRLRRIRAAH